MGSMAKHPLVLLAILASAAWLLVLAQAIAVGVGMVELAAAMMFTTMLVAWPFLVGMRRRPSGAWIHVAPCRECGMSGMGAQAFGFCIRCGAIPRPAARAAKPAAAPMQG